MKLEEVLPAMRAGRMATDCLGNEWGIHQGSLYIQDSQGFCYTNQIPPLFGWTLEDEQKVEWLKGSFQWALCNAGGGGMIRRKDWPDAMAHFVVGRRSPVDVDDLFHLDWKVVS